MSYLINVEDSKGQKYSYRNNEGRDIKFVVVATYAGYTLPCAEVHEQRCVVGGAVNGAEAKKLVEVTEQRFKISDVEIIRKR